MIITLVSLLTIGMCCNTAKNPISISLVTDETFSGCFQIDEQMPVILRTLPASKQSKKTHAHNSEDKEDDASLLLGNAILTYSNDDCSINGLFETCYFGKEELKQEEFKFKLKCTQGPCKLNLELIQQKAKILKNDELQLDNDEDIHLFMIDIPEEFVRLVVSIKSDNVVLSNMLVNVDFFGSQPQVSKSDTRLVALFDGRDPELCRSCQVPMIVSGHNLQEELSFQLTYKLIEEQNLEQIDQLNVDALLGDTENVYKYIIQENLKNQQLAFTLKQISGQSKRIRVYSGDKYDPEKESLWDIFTAEKSTEILIESTNSENLYFRIQSITDGAYIFKLTTYKSKQIPITIGNTEFGRISPTQVQNFLLKIEKSDKVITLNLEAITGTSIIQYDECSPDSCEPLTKLDDSEEKAYFHFQSDCKEVDTKNRCWYNIAISAGFRVLQGDLDSVYKFNVYEQPSNQVLKANQPCINDVDEEQKQFYTFFLENPEQISMVTFRVSSPNVQMLVARKCKLVDWDCKLYSGTSDMPIVLSGKKKLEGPYYISIEGISFTQYSITVEVSIADKQQVIELRNGQIYQSSVSTKVLSQCFFFKQNKQSLINISMHGPNHKLVMYANPDSDIPTEMDYEEKSINSIIQLIAQQVTVCVYPLQATFSPDPHNSDVKYNATESWMDVSLYSAIHFSILIYTESAIINLDWNSPYYGSIALTQQMRFNFITYVDQDLVYITKSILSLGNSVGDLKVYIGSNSFSDPDEYEIEFIDHDSSTFVLNGQQLRRICQDNEQDAPESNQGSAWICDVFILVKTSSKSPIRFTLTVHKRDLAIEAVEGHHYQYNLEHISDPDKNKGEGYMHFYFKPTNKINEINLFASSFFGKLSIYINIWRIDENIHKSEWPFADSNSDVDNELDYHSGRFNQLHRAIKAEALEQCWPKCLVLISLSHLDDAQMNEYAEKMGNQFEILYDDQFSLLVTQGYQDIIEGQKIEFSLQSDQYKYFIFRNLERFRDDSNLLFSLMSFIGNGYFSITVNGRDNITIPHINMGYDFHSDGQYLEISKQQLTEKLSQKNIPISEAYLIIAVGGFRSYFTPDQKNETFKLEFSLTYLNMDIISILHAVPHEFRALPKKISIAQFYNYYFSSIKIRIHRTSGYGSIKIYPCPSPNTLQDCLEDSKIDDFKPFKQFNVVGSSNTQITINKDDQGYCSFCVYLIQINSDDDVEMNGQITIMLEGDYVKLVPGVVFDDSLEIKEIVHYLLSFSISSEIEIIIKINHGDPSAYISYQQEIINKTQIYKKNSDNNLIHITIPPRRVNDDQLQMLHYNFIHDEVYLTLESDTINPANYSIQYSVGQITGNLQDGRIHVLLLSTLYPNATLIYENYDSSIDPLLEIAPFNGTSLDDFNITVNYIKKYTKDDYQFDEKIQNIEIKKRQSHPSSRTYQFPNKLGLFEIFIQNKKATILQRQDQIFLEVSMSGKDIKILPFNRHMNGFIPGGQQAINYYEVLAPKQGIIVIEMNTCQTEINLGYSQNLTQFLIEDFDSDFNVTDGSYQIDPIKVDRGTLWIGIHNYQRQDAYYHISSYFYESKQQIPFGKFKPGNGGLIKWSVDKQKVDQIIIEFDHLDCLSCQNMEDIQVDYHIFIAQGRQKLFMHGYCNHDEFDNQKESKNQIQKEPIQSYKIGENDTTVRYEIKFPDLVTYEFAVVGVMATINNFKNQTNQIKVFYSPSEVPVPNYLAKILHRNHTFFSVVIIAMIVLISLLTIWLCYYMKRFKQTSVRLEYELTEGRRVVGLHKLPQNDDAAFRNDIKMKYDNLEEDN